MSKNYQFCKEWLENPKWSWVRPTSDPFKVQCELCKTQLSIASIGTVALNIHGKGKRHRCLNRMSKNYQFCNEWLENPKWSWVRPTSDPYKVQCELCKTQLSIALLGTVTLNNHGKGKRHRAIQRELSNIDTVHPPSLQSSEDQMLKMDDDGEQKPLSMAEKPAEERMLSNKTGEMEIPTNKTVELEKPPSQVHLDFERILPDNAHFNKFQKTEENILMKTEPDTAICIDATERMEIDEPLQRLSKEIGILQQCAAEKAELCEATGNFRYVIESNILSRMAKEKIKELQRLKSC